MEMTDDFVVASVKFPRPKNLADHLTFPMIGEVPVVAIDLDDTLAVYNGWEGPDHFGPPRPKAIWALRCFKHNGWEVEIFTSRQDPTRVKKLWVDKYAPGLIDRINESRNIKDDHPLPGRDSPKPKVDLFIDDRSEYWFGRELDWEEIMERLNKRGFLPKGLLSSEASD